MCYFVRFKVEGEWATPEYFIGLEQFWAWLQSFYGQYGFFPNSLSVYKAECLFDGS